MLKKESLLIHVMHHFIAKTNVTDFVTFNVHWKELHVQTQN